MLWESQQSGNSRRLFQLCGEPNYKVQWMVESARALHPGARKAANCNVASVNQLKSVELNSI